MPKANRLFAGLLPLITVTLLGCAHGDPAASAQVHLLGETHDNGDGHQLRAKELRKRIDSGW